ncbi:MAG: protease modulator HflC [Deltaproteobacteria bacterium]|nr:protease modulator HflC [Deltaproteobacteria bacterium]
MKWKTLIIPIIIAAIAVYSSAYIIDETEQVIITQFGRVIGKPKSEPGLYFKIPIIQNANFFPKNLLAWDGDEGQVPTLDKTFLYVDAFARWKIVDPLKFFQTVNNITGALARLDDIIDPAVRNFVTSYPLIETVRNSNRVLEKLAVEVENTMQEELLAKITTGRAAITRGIMAQAQPKLADFGIELVDVQIKRLNYVEEVRKSVYARMIAERNQMAQKFRSEGEGEARSIEGNRDKELKRITSEAYRIAQEKMGKADAEATMIYAKAYGRDPEFYSFVKSLGVYEKTMDKETALVLSTDSDFLKYFKSYMDKSPVRRGDLPQ